MKNIFAILLLLPALASADSLSLDLNLTAYHGDRQAVKTENLNETNPGIGLRWTDGDYHKMLGVYKNSNYKQSAYALMAYTPIKIGAARLGAVAGVVTGYESPYQPVAGLYAVLPVTERLSLNITAVPDVKSIKCYGFAGFQLSIAL
jgi:hypothetical protein